MDIATRTTNFLMANYFVILMMCVLNGFANDVDEQDGTWCYDCIEKFKYVYRPDDCIANVTHAYKPRKCQDHEKFCKIEFTKVNGIFTVFERNCQSDCETFCKIRGYGLWEETCRFCCNHGNATSACNTTNSAAKMMPIRYEHVLALCSLSLAKMLLL